MVRECSDLTVSEHGRRALIVWAVLAPSGSAVAPNRGQPETQTGVAMAGAIPGNDESGYCPVGEGACDGGGAAGYLQPAVNVFQVGAHCSVGNAEPAGDLGVGVPGGQQAQHVPLPGGEPGDGAAAALVIQICLVQVRAHQREQRPVPVGEVRPGPAEEEQRTADCVLQQPMEPVGMANVCRCGAATVELPPLAAPVDQLWHVLLDLRRRAHGAVDIGGWPNGPRAHARAPPVPPQISQDGYVVADIRSPTRDRAGG